MRRVLSLLVLSLLVLSFVLSFVLTVVVRAQVPAQLSYQGLLTTPQGTPISDGAYTVTFRLYADADDGQPTEALFEETQTVAVASGLFSTMIGKEALLDLPFDEPYFLTVEVEGQAESAKMPLSTAPYALNVADGAVVRSLSGLKDDVEIVAGDGIAIAQQDNRLVISALTTPVGLRSADGGASEQPSLLGPAGSNVGLDAAYDAGRIITADAGGVEIHGTSGSTPLRIFNGNLLFEDNTGGKPNLRFKTSGGTIGTQEWRFNLNAIGYLTLRDATGGANVFVLVPGAQENLLRLTGGAVEIKGVLSRPDGQPLEVQVGGARVMRFDPQTATEGPNVVGGWSGNSVGAGVVGATIAGGGDPDYFGAPRPNEVTADYGTVDGGLGNTASDIYATVGGGRDNTASASSATVGGGSLNTASDTYATVGGGLGNTASGFYATVTGGRAIQAGGDYSFAAGRRAKVRDDDPASPFYSGDLDGDEGTFVWADSEDADFVSTGPDQFLIRASGGVGLGTNTPDAPLDLQGQNNWSPAITEGDFRIGNDTHRLVFGVALDGGGAGHARIHTKSSSSDRLYLGNDGTDVAVIQSTVGLYPAADNTFSLGQSGQRWTEVWSVNGSINTSDRRAKEEIEGLDYGLEAVLRLRAVSYRWKDRPGGQRRLGLIAQEVAEVVPEVVRRPASAGALFGLSYGELVPVLIRAVQQQQAEITQQQAEIEALRAQVAAVDQVQAEMARQQTEMARQQAEMAALRALVEAAVGAGAGPASSPTGETGTTAPQD